MSYQERLSGAQAPALYAISLLVVFLVPGGAVRELVGAVLGDAGGAAGGDWRPAGDLDARAGE
ncbi:hypothetical protein LNQ52_17435 [Klebsiella pneumoniae subsp. pneumoniae]|nr:hypothetical protein [Klebsiella pneumoniae subsp. pneumoniae]